MSSEHELLLTGCTTRPLANYLKALGVFRIVVEQGLDPDARARFGQRGMILRTTASYDQLRSFLAEDYQPVPAFSPWNSGAGFVGKGGKENIERILKTSAERFAPMRRSIEQIHRVQKQTGANQQFFKDSTNKAKFYQRLRNIAPPTLLQWLDAVASAHPDGELSYPALLGTGGNDGRLEFSRKYLERVVTLFVDDVPEHRQNAWLDHALLRDAVGPELEKEAIGQFAPSDAGSPNGGVSFESNALVNPWDYVLLFEGTLAFEVSLHRRSRHTKATLAAPFAARSTEAGFASSVAGESGRDELWLPVWHQWATWSEIHHLFEEGRVSVDGRAARDGLDFARATSSLGVDRGIDTFERYGFLERNGLSHIATSLGTFPVSRDQRSGLLAELDQWIGRWRGRLSAADKAPASVQRAFRAVVEAEIEYCRNPQPGRFTKLLIQLGELQRSLFRSRSFSQKADGGVPPLPPLSVGWLDTFEESVGTKSREFRLALSLVRTFWRSAPDKEQAGTKKVWLPDFRQYVENVGRSGRYSSWLEPERNGNGRRSATWTDGSLVSSLTSYLDRRKIDAEQHGLLSSWNERSRAPARLDDVLAFVDGRVDERKLEQFVFSLILIDWRDVGFRPVAAGALSAPPFVTRTFAMPRLALSTIASTAENPAEREERQSVRFDPQIPALLKAGRVDEAVWRAERRLFIDGFAPSFRSRKTTLLAKSGRADARRLLASLAFPLDRPSLYSLSRTFLSTERSNAVENEVPPAESQPIMEA